jgi:hypothetical protein
MIAEIRHAETSNAVALFQKCDKGEANLGTQPVVLVLIVHEGDDKERA